MAKFLVVVSTQDPGAASLAVRWAAVALSSKWAEDVEVAFFGPSQKLLVEGEESVMNAITALREAGKEPMVCERVADAMGVKQVLVEKGFKLGPVGETIGKLADQGYKVLVW